MKYLLLELPESEDIEARLSVAGLKGRLLGVETGEISADTFIYAAEMQAALSVLYSFCNSTSVYLSIPEQFLLPAGVVLEKVREK
jgi:hypothetical protein